MKSLLLEARGWSRLMGRDLERSDLQPLRVVRIRNGTLALNARTLRALGLSPGQRVLVQQKNGRCLVRKHRSRGVSIEKGKGARLDLPQGVQNAICRPDAAGAVIVGREGEASILPLILQEHQADALGPRLIDELRDNAVVRHAVPGPSRDDWTPEALRELEELVCAEPFQIDPIPPIAQGDDWVGWMTRAHILNRLGPNDDSLRESLVADIYRSQREDGSWEAVPATAYSVLRLLELGEQASDDRIRLAAKWLLDLPEPQPRPGMWMLTPEYLEEWMSKRQPKESRDFGAGEFQWTGPGARSFYSGEYPDSEQDQFRGQEVQQAIPICARHHAPACEPRITHISALVAEALIRCGYADHRRLRRYLNTVFRVGGEWGYWCGCGALGLFDSDIPTCEASPDFNVRMVAVDGRIDMSPWRWVPKASQSARLAAQTSLPDRGSRGTHLLPFSWRSIPEEETAFAVVGTAWQNGDCWAKVNRALAHHPACPGSLTEVLAIYQASRYQTSLGEWEQGFPAGMLAFLSLYSHGAAKSLVMKSVPWLREHQAEDGLWHHEELAREDSGKSAEPLEPRLATYHIVAALHRLGLTDRLRP